MPFYYKVTVQVNEPDTHSSPLQVAVCSLSKPQNFTEIAVLALDYLNQKDGEKIVKEIQEISEKEFHAISNGIQLA